ncbi:MAG TPA: hypothetical protein VGH80_01310 [Xanthomonadaceae bacterium]|jgi:hypothetical protein
MLEVLEAVRFDGDAQGGATIPSKMECLRPNGQSADVFVKFSSVRCPVGGLAREVIGCLLAQSLDIAVGIPVLVSVHADLIEQVKSISPETGARMRNSASPAFGSISLGSGFSLCNATVTKPLLQFAAEIWAFDQLTLNPDRNSAKPNCMTNGSRLVAIDHEKALEVVWVGGLVPAPWEDRWQPEAGHLFYNLLRGGGASLDRLEKTWRTIDESRVRDFASNVPAAWQVNDVVSLIVEYLCSLHANLSAAFSNLKKVMQP